MIVKATLLLIVVVAYVYMKRRSAAAEGPQPRRHVPPASQPALPAAPAESASDVAAPAAQNGSDDAESEIREYVARAVSAGFDSPAAIIESTNELVEEEHPGHESLVRTIVAEELRRHAAEELTWPVVTDCDRLDAAFARLEANGIVARQNFTCCQGCGSSEIWTEIEESAAPTTVRGYTYFHMQDTESAVEDGSLHLAYGATEDAEDAAIRIGNEIVATLEAEGLAPQWNGQLSQRISVPLDWKKRRSAFKANDHVLN